MTNFIEDTLGELKPLRQPLADLTKYIFGWIGALLLGIFINTYLFGLVSYQYFGYFVSKTFDDALWIRLTVALLCLVDTFHSLSLIYLAWTYLIRDFSNPMAMLDILWPYPMTIVATASIALITHFFFIYKIVRPANKYVYGVLLFLSFATFGSGLASGVKIFSIVTPLDMSALNKPLTVWLSLEMIVDISICAFLLIGLSRSRTGFDQSNSVINRLMRASVQTGLLTSLSSMLVLTLFLALPGTTWYTVIGVPMGRCYTNTLMDTLMCREGLRNLLLSKSELEFSMQSVKVTIHREIKTDLKVDRSEKHRSLRFQTDFLDAQESVKRASLR